jgi:formamidopyrimidine-DNA glycosylase
MPEGHSIHRYARLHRALLGGRRVAASSPQGRFAAGACVLNGATLVDVQAYGKHLFYRFASPDTERHAGRAPDGDVSLHVHLGLFGRFRAYERDPLAPTPETRLVLSAAGPRTQPRVRASVSEPVGGDLAVRASVSEPVGGDPNGSASGPELQLSGPTVCELIDQDVEAALRDRLGPDPLRSDDPSAAFAALARRTAPIGQVLLDQRIIAGIGNVYRAEVLFLIGVHPDRPAHAVDPATLERLWDLLRMLMTDGERRGRIITLQPPDRTGPRSKLASEDERLYVYNRAGRPCRRCATPITSWGLAGRTIFACRRCQPE